MADSPSWFLSFLHSSSSHFSAMLSAACKVLLPVLIATNIAVVISHYFAFGSRKPAIVGGKGRLRNVLTALSTKVDVFRPTIWSFGGHLHTILGDLLRRRPKIVYISEDVDTPDGGVVRLDWASWDDNERARTPSESENIVLILPGLTGNSYSPYALQFVEEAQRLGYRAVVLNHRGTAMLPRTYRYCCAANSDDLEQLVQHIHTKFQNCRICVVGVSLGGIITTNYLIRMSQSRKNSGLLAALVISIPYDPFVSADSLEKPITCFLFNRYLTRKLQEMYVRNGNALKAVGVDVPEKHSVAAAKANTIRQFDDAVIAPMFGYKDCSDYYRAASIVRKPFECIQTPLLCLSAEDDPFSPSEQIPVERMKDCENVALLLTHVGGHVGFMEGILPFGQGYMDRVYKHFIKTAFDEL